MTTLDLLKRRKPDWQLFRQRSASEPGMAHLVAHIGSVPIPLGPFLSVTGLNAALQPQSEIRLAMSCQGSLKTSAINASGSARSSRLGLAKRSG
jgi:hypothetical protein